MIRRVGFVLVFVVVVTAAAPTGAPVQLSYVYADSMEPTIETGDGYVLVPAGTVSPGDIVTFRSRQRGAYVTHRVVERSAEGFVTRGDNNPTTDQATGHPPIDRESIVGKVLTVGGRPVVVPHLGTVLEPLRTHISQLLVGCLGAVLLYSTLRGTDRRRTPSRIRHVFRPLFVIGFVATTGLLVFGQPSQAITLVAVETAGVSDAPGVIAVGASKPLDVVVHQNAGPLTTRVVTTRGLEDVTSTRNATAVHVSGTVPPPESTGPVRVDIDRYRYPALVPRWLLTRLQAVHPLLASGASATAVLAPLWVGYRVLMDPQTPIRSRPARWQTILWRGWR
jgi:signal peptidase